MEIANDLEDVLKRKVDIVDLDNADLYFIHQVMLNKEIVFDRDIDRRVSFEADKRRKYFDMKRFYDLYHRQALKGLKGMEGSIEMADRETIDAPIISWFILVSNSSCIRVTAISNWFNLVCITRRADSSWIRASFSRCWAILQSDSW